MTATATNPITGVEYYTAGPMDGQSVHLYVTVKDGQVLNPNGVRWPFTNGAVHDQDADYYRIVPFTPIPFDPMLFSVDPDLSGWQLKPASNQLGELIDVPDGHPKGTYEKTEVIVRRTKDELRELARGFYSRANSELWPQEPGYEQKLAYAKAQVAAGNDLQQYRNVLDRHDLLIAALFANDARLAELFAEIKSAGDTGPVDFVASEGWTNAIPE